MMETARISGRMGHASRTYMGRCDMPAQVADALEALAFEHVDLTEGIDDRCERMPVIELLSSDTRGRGWIAIVEDGQGGYDVAMGSESGKSGRGGAQVIEGHRHWLLAGVVLCEPDPGAASPEPNWLGLAERVLGWWLSAPLAPEGLIDGIDANELAR